jgi:hypothetical protein
LSPKFLAQKSTKKQVFDAVIENRFFSVGFGYSLASNMSKSSSEQVLSFDYSHDWCFLTLCDKKLMRTKCGETAEY